MKITTNHFLETAVGTVNVEVKNGLIANFYYAYKYGPDDPAPNDLEKSLLQVVTELHKLPEFKNEHARR